MSSRAQFVPRLVERKPGPPRPQRCPRGVGLTRFRSPWYGSWIYARGARRGSGNLEKHSDHRTTSLGSDSGALTRYSVCTLRARGYSLQPRTDLRQGCALPDGRRPAGVRREHGEIRFSVDAGRRRVRSPRIDCPDLTKPYFVGDSFGPGRAAARSPGFQPWEGSEDASRPRDKSLG